MTFRKMEVSGIAEKINPISMIQDNWYLVTAEDNGTVNTLTAAWGGLGNVCGKSAATVYIRPQRYTKKFMDASGRFTMTFFDFDKYQPALMYLGSHSGADDPDKIEHAGLHLTHVEGEPACEEGKYVLVCRTFFRQPMDPANFIDPKDAEANYPDKDYSVIYIAEIVAAYEQVSE